MTGAQLFGAWCTTLTIVFIWPQVWRVWSENTTEGLSPTATVTNVVSSNLWLAYGLAMDRPAGWVANVSFTAALTAIGLAQIRDRTMPGRHLAGAQVASLAAIGATLSISTDAVAWAAIAIGIGATVPQFLHVVRTRDLSGISLPSMAILLASCVSWAIYGLVADVILYTIPQFLIIPANGYITVRAVLWRRSAAAHAAH